MALVNAALERFTDASCKSNLQQEYLAPVKRELKLASRTNPYNTPADTANALEAMGIASNPWSVSLHTHAGAKAIENRMLEIVGKKLPKSKVTFMFLKRSKLTNMCRNHRLGDTFMNMHLEPRDAARYTQRTLVDNYKRVDTSVAFMADTLHYLKPTFLADLFENSPNLMVLYATVVLPIEAEYKHPSLHPEIYTINYAHGGFQYIPGGHTGGAYHHEFKQLDWLKIGKIKYLTNMLRPDKSSAPKTLTIQMEECLGANVLLTIHRGDMLTPSTRTFAIDEYVTLPQIFHPHNMNVSKPIKKVLAMQLFMYVKSIKTVTERDIHAKIRQLIKTSDLGKLDPVEEIHICNYYLFMSQLTSITCYQDILSNNIIKRYLVHFTTPLRMLWEKIVGAHPFRQLMKALEWKTFTYTVKVKQVYGIYTGREYGSWGADERDPWASDDEEEDDIGPSSNRDPTPTSALITESAAGITPKEHAYRFDQNTLYLRGKQALQHLTDNVVDISEPAADNPPTPETGAAKGNLVTNLLKKVWRPKEDNGGKREHEPEEEAVKRPGKEVLSAPSFSERGECSTGSAQRGETAPEHQPGRSNGPRVVSWADLEAEQECEGDEESKTGKGPADEELNKVIVPWNKWLPILNKVGFKGDEMQFDGSGTLIYPITELERHPKTGAHVPCVRLLNMLKDLNRLPVMVPINPKRAMAYASDLKYCKTGELLKRQPLQWKETFQLNTQEGSPLSMPIVVIHGAGGSGKSRCLQTWLKTTPEQEDSPATIIVPTNELRQDWSDKLENIEPRHIKTFEKACLQTCKKIVVMDDYTKLPAGYIEAFIYNNRATELVILTGDSKQSKHHEQNGDAAICQLKPASEIFQPYCRYYINATHRNKRDVANALGVYSEVAGRTVITMSSKMDPSQPLLCPSRIKKEAMAELGQRTMTYAGCQGLTTKHVQILLDECTPHCSEQVLYTALSRATESIHFINTGPNSNDFWAKLDCTPYLKTFLSTVREQKFAEMHPVDVEPTEPEPPATHFPVENHKMLLDGKMQEPREKFERELHSNSHGHSNCFQTEDEVVQLVAHQQAKDETLLWATIEKRIRLSQREENVRDFRLKADIGDLLFFNYKQAMGLPVEPIPFMPDLWDHCRAEIQRTYLSKPLHMLKNGILRQSPDFYKNAISLFLKSQWQTKVEKMGLPAKAGQTIASFAQETVMLYGTMARYMRRCREAYYPDNIYIHCERTPEDMSNFIKEKWNFKATATTNDYTAFDQSQDASMLQFEIMKAKFHSIPEKILVGYLEIKTDARIFLGTLKIMRLTGEGPTFDANTECSIAYMHTKYHIPRGTAMMFAGDDFAASAKLEEKASFQMIREELALTEKRVELKQEKGSWAQFCGDLITPLGAIKDPIKLYLSWEVAKRTGRLDQVAASYGKDLRNTYIKGDLLQDVFNEEQAAMHQTMVRDFHERNLAKFLV